MNLILLAVPLASWLCLFSPPALAQTKTDAVECMKNVGFYRNPKRGDDVKASGKYCSEFYECTDTGVFKYGCGMAQRFNVMIGHCDYRKNVNNSMCEIVSKGGKPLLEGADCPQGQLGCADATCLAREKFCDETPDCPDGSDETHCTVWEDPNAAPMCNLDTCKATPGCYCSPGGADIPGNLKPEQTPQMIMLSFDDAINTNNYPIFKELLLQGFVNPNGCPIPATFYLSHRWTDYRLVQDMYKRGNEIALHSISHKAPEDWWTKASQTDLESEFLANRKIINDFGLIPQSEIKGLRMPWLRLGANRQFRMMKANNITFDHTIVAPYPSEVKYWPYTLDFRMPHRCFSSREDSCPTRSFPGTWVVPMNPLSGAIDTGPRAGLKFHCPMMDMCPTMSFEEMYDFLIKNFNKHYMGNRAPFGLYFHSRWFVEEGHFTALQHFINHTLSMPDVYYATASQVINWVKHPEPVGSPIKAFECPARNDVPAACSEQSAYCGVLPASSPGSPTGTMFTCRTFPKRCPTLYPWVNNTDGELKSLEVSLTV